MIKVLNFVVLSVFLWRYFQILVLIMRCCRVCGGGATWRWHRVARATSQVRCSGSRKSLAFYGSGRSRAAVAVSVDGVRVASVCPRELAGFRVFEAPGGGFERCWVAVGATMVLAEKNNENARNGRRSRGPSPNGHVQAESTSEDESTVPVDKIRVGRDYQAICPELQPETLRKPELLADRALLVWSPTTDIPEIKLEEYIVLAKDKYGYNGEQALGMLFWHKHDLDRAVLDLANFTPFPDEWSVEDKVLFEQAFQFHGKSFHRIRQMLPDKSIASLVKYYYSWKKTRSRTSLMDKQARKLNTPREEGAPSEGGSEGGSNEDSDHDEKKWTIHRGIRRKSGSPLRAGQAQDENSAQIQQNKQQLSSLKRKHSDTIDELRPSGDNSSRINARWTNEELLLAVQGVRKYGKDFKSIAEVLGNKTEQHVRSFFVNYRKRYNLDNVLKDYENDHGPIDEPQEPPEKMEIEEGNDNNSDVICLSPTPTAKKAPGKVVVAQNK